MKREFFQRNSDAPISPLDPFAAEQMLTTCKAVGRPILGRLNAMQPDVPTEDDGAVIEAWKEHVKYA